MRHVNSGQHLIVMKEKAEGKNIISLSGINDLEQTAARLSLEINDAKGRTVYRKSMDTNWKQGISQLFKQDLITKSWNGTYTIQARLLANDHKLLTENTYSIDIFKEKD